MRKALAAYRAEMCTDVTEFTIAYKYIFYILTQTKVFGLIRMITASGRGQAFRGDNFSCIWENMWKELPG